jgi:hypothetical protein
LRAAVLGSLAALALLAGCGVKVVEGKVGVEPSMSGDSTAVVRVSGTEGVHYFGSYGLLEDKLERLTGALGAEPTSYEVPVEERGPTYDYVHANFMKLAPEGYLRVEILWEDEVVARKTTRAEEGVVTLNYRPPDGRDGTAEEGSRP